eukprot:Nk52_evm52s352 gene=Nk52_evmTU52s352
MDLPPNNTLYVNNLNEKVKKDELKKSLYFLFGQFGVILDIVAIKTFRARGQAFIIFQDLFSATQALRSLQGIMFYDKPMRIAYAKTESDIIAKKKGNFTERPRTERKSVTEILAEKPAKAAANGFHGHAAGDQDVEMEEVRHEILFVENISEEFNESMLSELFKQFPGFKEARSVPGRGDIAFVEFELEQQAADAKTGLQGFKIGPANELRISFSKR